MHRKVIMVVQLKNHESFDDKMVNKCTLYIKCSYSQNVLKMMLVSFCKNLGSKVAIEIKLWFNHVNASVKMVNASVKMVIL